MTESVNDRVHQPHTALEPCGPVTRSRRALSLLARLACADACTHGISLAQCRLPAQHSEPPHTPTPTHAPPGHVSSAWPYFPRREQTRLVTAEVGGNRDYTDFVSVSTNLVDVEGAVLRIRTPLHDLKAKLQHARDRTAASLDAINQGLARRQVGHALYFSRVFFLFSSPHPSLACVALVKSCEPQRREARAAAAAAASRRFDDAGYYRRSQIGVGSLPINGFLALTHPRYIGR